MYTMMLIVVSGLGVYFIIKNSIFFDNVMMLVALPFLGFAFHWIRCRTRHPFKYFVPQTATDVRSKQIVFTVRVHNFWKTLSHIIEDYFILILTSSLMTIRVATMFTNISIGLQYTFYGIITTIFIIFCLILLLELLITIGRIEALTFVKWMYRSTITGGWNTFEIFFASFRQFDQMFYWWTIKFVYFQLVLFLAHIISIANFKLLMPLKFVQQFLVFNFKTKSMNGVQWVKLLFHDEVVYNRSLPVVESYGAASTLSLPIPTDFYVFVAFAASLSRYADLIGFLNILSHVVPVLLYVLSCLVHWKKQNYEEAEEADLKPVVVFIINMACIIA